MMLLLVGAWLVVEFGYAVAQRTFLARGRFGSALLNRLADLLFEPLADQVVASEPVPFRARDLDHARHGGVYQPGGTIRIELTPTSVASVLTVQPIVRRVEFDAGARRPRLSTAASWKSFELRADGARIDGVLPRKPGMYIVEFVNPTRARIAVAAFVSAESDRAPVAVLPTFTVWGYHQSSGFYPGHGRPPAERRLAAIGRLGLAGRAFALAMRVAAKRLFGIHVNQPSWPVHASVRLDRYYETNHRWTKQLWDRELASFEGLWNDDIDITIPFFALADAHDVEFRLATDLDLHRREDWLTRADHWIFVGQESLTTDMWQHLDAFAAAHGKITLWCPQGFGYRQVAYDDATSTLAYVCSRGRRGFWNEPLEDQDPPWDEGRLFGFRFPSPDSAEATNPHRVQYDALTVAKPMRGTQTEIAAGTVTAFRIWANNGWRPGLNWMGGEPFRRVRPEAVVHVHMSADTEVIGYGTFENTCVVSPTFLGALWAYGDQQALVEAIFQHAVVGPLSARHPVPRQTPPASQRTVATI